MPVNDQTPRYWLRDSDGNIVGSFYINANGNPAIQEGTNQNELTLQPDGTVSSPGLEATESFTDPAGVEHTGELADLDDVGSGGARTLSRRYGLLGGN